jgi:hypothetical protein
MGKVYVYTQIWLRLSTEMRECAIRKKKRCMKAMVSMNFLCRANNFANLFLLFNAN